MSGIYVHIPFCVKKCLYCDFYSVPKEPGGVSVFLTALEGELELVADSPVKYILQEATTLYLGGGTPSCLSEKELETLFELLSKHVDLPSLEEISVEANPGTISPGKAALLKELGVTRVSLGAQSFHDGLLSFLGRIHRKDEIISSFETLLRAGFENINLDLIFGVPGQGKDLLTGDLKEAISLAPAHLSLYALSVEEGTPLHELVLSGLSLPGEDETADQYEMIREFLEKEGFEHYEVSNFCRPGFECRHNLGYWLMCDYLGLGPSAAGLARGEDRRRGTRWTNQKSLEEYVSSVREGKLPREEIIQIDLEELWKERLMLGLRLTAGITLSDAEAELGPIPDALRAHLDELIGDGLLIRQGGRIFIPREKFFTMNSILVRLL